ncbi:MAG: hypothetical protein NXY57DRAFT_1075741 [Lentinula lateritia]|nr:MAG: hypothetical protein NXY57DRAFT_1075741 [Lentinula lateritia]
MADTGAVLVITRHEDRRKGAVANGRGMTPGSSNIKASRADSALSKMSPAIRPPLVPRILSQHPYHVENERLAACIRLLESQLAFSRQENATLTSALCDTSISLEGRQGGLDQLQESVSSAAQHQELYDHLLDQVQTLERALPGPPNESLVDIETLQEEVHRFRECALFAEKMIRKYPDEGYYSVSLPPLVEVQGDLNETLVSLRRVTTFAHRLYRCDPASVLHQHNRYVGVIIDAVISFLPLTWLGYLGQGRACPSIQWFFANAAEREEGIYHLVLAHSHFSDDAPFLNVAQHAGFVAPFDDSLEPPLHRRMFALDTALPHHGAGNWEDLVPALSSLDCLTQEWEAMMSSYIRFVTDTPLPQVDPQEEGSGDHEEVSVLQEGEGGVTAAVPLFLPDSLSTTPTASAASPPSLPPRFGSVTNLAIDMIADEDDEDIYESPGSVERRNRLEGNPGEDDPMGDGPVVQGQ